MRYIFCGKEKRATIGHYPLLSLKEARERAIDASRVLSVGVDPFEKKAHGALADGTFEAIALDWIEKQAPRWSDEHRGTVKKRLEMYAFPQS